jgi:uncharacterized protein YegP (UPF0339 family)
MYFLIVKTEHGYHARLYDENSKLLFWSKDYPSERAAVAVCGTTRQTMTPETPIRTESR